MSQRERGRDLERCKPNESVRDEQGMSLATVLVMTIILTTFVASMFTNIFQVYRKVASLRYGTTLRAYNEAALDYMLDKSNALQQVLPDGVSSIPSTVTGDADAVTTVTVSNQGTPPTFSILDNPNNGAPYKLLTATTKKGPLTKSLQVLLQPIDVAPPETPNTIFALFGTNRVEFVGKAGINSYNTPDPRLWGDIGTFGAGNQVGTGAANRGVIQGGNQFEFPVGNQFITAVNATMATYNATTVSQASWVHILGNIYSNGDNTGPNSGYWPRYNGSGAVNGKQDWNNVFGAANGTLDDAGKGVPSGVRNGSTNSSLAVPQWSGESGQGIANNWGRVGDGANPFSSTNPYTGGRVGSFMNYTPPTLPSAPLAPAGSPNLGSINITGSGKLVISPGAAAPTGPIGTIGNGQTHTIPPGDYQVSTLSIQDTGSIQVNPSVGTDHTRFFLNPPPANTGNNAPPALSLSNSTNVNMSYNGTNGLSGGAPTGMTMNGTSGFGPTPNANNMPAIDTSAGGRITETAGTANNLQIYTNSVCNMVLAGNARAYINAPNATVNIGGQSGTLPAYTSGGRDANFYGSIVGGITRIISDFSGNSAPAAWMHFDGNFKRATVGGPLRWNDPWAFAGNPLAGYQSKTEYRAVTWQEL